MALTILSYFPNCILLILYWAFWIVLDSLRLHLMAYNIPKVVACLLILFWLAYTIAHEHKEPCR